MDIFVFYTSACNMKQVYTSCKATSYHISSKYLNWLWRYEHFCVLPIRQRHLIAALPSSNQFVPLTNNNILRV